MQGVRARETGLPIKRLLGRPGVRVHQWLIRNQSRLMSRGRTLGHHGRRRTELLSAESVPPAGMERWSWAEVND